MDTTALAIEQAYLSQLVELANVTRTSDDRTFMAEPPADPQVHFAPPAPSSQEPLRL